VTARRRRTEYDNNVFELSLPIEGSRVYLPLVLRNH